MRLVFELEPLLFLGESSEVVGCSGRIVAPGGISLLEPPRTLRWKSDRWQPVPVIDAVRCDRSAYTVQGHSVASKLISARADLKAFFH